MIWVCETCWIRRWAPWVAAALAILVVQAPGSPAASQGPAVEQLAAHCEAHPGDADARYELGVALLEARRYEEAIEALRETAKLQRRTGVTDPRTCNALGWAHMLAGDHEEAEEALLEALEHEGSADLELRRKILNNLGVFYLDRNDFGRARKYLTRAAQELGSPTARRELAKLERLEAQRAGSRGRR